MAKSIFTFNFLLKHISELVLNFDLKELDQYTDFFD